MTRVDRVRPFVSLPAAAGLLVAGALLCTPADLRAQPGPPSPADNYTVPPRDWSEEVPAHVSFAEGDVWLERDGTVDGAPTGVPLLVGDRLRTRAGRLEVLFADGSLLLLDEHSDAKLLADDLLRIDAGRLRLELSRPAGAAGYRIDAAGTTTWFRAAGEYRLDVDNRQEIPDVRLLVIRGLAELSANDRTTLVRAGYEAFASASTTPSLPYAVTVSSWDSFDRAWDDRQSSRSGVASAEYLPAEVATYAGVLERDGDWQYDSTYGYVWYPHVADSWHPYSSGRWSFVGSYGWVWVGTHRWAWPTHHYGRWGYSGRRYYWIPGRQWAPAWVAWASSPSYVGWVPLGYNNRPLVSIHIGASSGWRGWTHVPARSFHTHVVIAQRGRYLPPASVRFNDRFRGPSRPSTIVVRQTPGLRGPGLARGSLATPRYPAAQTRSTTNRVGAPATPARATPSRSVTAPGQFRDRPAGAPAASRAMPAAGERDIRQAERPTGSRMAPSRTPTARTAENPVNDRGAAAPGVRRASPPVANPAPSTRRVPASPAPAATTQGPAVTGARPRPTVGPPAAAGDRVSRPQPRTTDDTSSRPAFRTPVPARAPEAAGAGPSRPAQAERTRGAAPDNRPSARAPQSSPAPTPRVERSRPTREAPADAPRGRAVPRQRQ